MSQWPDATTSVWKASLSRYTTNPIQYTCSSVTVARNAWRSTYDGVRRNTEQMVSLRRWPSKSQSSGPKEVGWQALPYWLPPQVGQGCARDCDCEIARRGPAGRLRIGEAVFARWRTFSTTSAVGLLVLGSRVPDLGILAAFFPRPLVLYFPSHSKIDRLIRRCDVMDGAQSSSCYCAVHRLQREDCFRR